MHDDGPVSQHAAADDTNGIALWNALSEPERGQWTARAGNTGQAKDAWEAFERDSHGADLAGLDDAIAGRTDAPCWIRQAARCHGVAYSDAAVDTFAAAVSRLSDAGVQLDLT